MLFNFLALQTLGGIVVSTLLYVYFKRQKEIQQRIDALGGSTIAIPGWLPFGIDLIFRDVRAAMKNKSMELWQSVFLECNGSRTVEAVVLGQRIVFTSDPQNIQAILSTQFQDFGKGKPFHDDWYEFLGDSIFTTDLQPWHDARQLLRPQFLRRRVSDLHVFEKHVEQLLLQFPTDSSTFDLSQLFLRYTMDVSTDFLFGTSTGSLEKEGGEFTEAFAEVQRMQNIFVRAGPANRVISRASFRKGLKIIEDFIAPYINEALSLSAQESSDETESETSLTFLHGLATHTKDRKVIRDQLVAMLLAGRDTTASALSWLFYELSQNPRIFNKLREEVIASLGHDRVPLMEDLKGMTYLQNVINEVLRLYPAVPFNVRMALSDTSLPTGGGPHQTAPIGILKDTAVAYSTLVVQRREDLYPLNAPNTSSFEPDRWENWRPDTWQYIPFNAGPRICIGQDFAMTEIKYTVVRLLQNISKLEARMLPSEQFMRTSIVMQPGAGVKVAVCRS